MSSHFDSDKVSNQQNPKSTWLVSRRSALLSTPTYVALSALMTLVGCRSDSSPIPPRPPIARTATPTPVPHIPTATPTSTATPVPTINNPGSALSGEQIGEVSLRDSSTNYDIAIVIEPLIVNLEQQEATRPTEVP